MGNSEMGQKHLKGQRIGEFIFRLSLIISEAAPIKSYQHNCLIHQCTQENYPEASSVDKDLQTTYGC